MCCTNSRILLYIGSLQKPEVLGLGLYRRVDNNIHTDNIYLHAKYHLPSAINEDFRGEKVCANNSTLYYIMKIGCR